MNPDDHAANDPNIDPLLNAIQRYTTPAAIVIILVTLVVNPLCRRGSGAVNDSANRTFRARN